MMMRSRSFPVASPLLFLLCVLTTGATLRADDALWRFNTHG